MPRVGREVVFYGLLVADVHKDIAEDTHLASFVKGHEQATLEHVLEQGNGLEADGFAAGVGSADDEHAVFFEAQGEGYEGLALLTEFEVENRVSRLPPLEHGLVVERGAESEQCAGIFGFGAEEIDVCECLLGGFDIGERGT